VLYDGSNASGTGRHNLTDTFFLHSQGQILPTPSYIAIDEKGSKLKGYETTPSTYDDPKLTEEWRVQVRGGGMYQLFPTERKFSSFRRLALAQITLFWVRASFIPSCAPSIHAL